MITFVIFIGSIILLLIALMKIGNDKTSVQNARPTKVIVPEYIKIEGKRRIQIINESLSIIGETKIIDTLNGRYIDVCDNVKWIYDNGISLSNMSKQEAENMVSDNKNENIVRIANHIYSTYNTKMSVLKTQKAKDNATSKMEKQLSECLSAIVQSSNDTVSRKSISEIIHKASIPKIVYSSVNVNTNGMTNEDKNKSYRKNDIDRWREQDFVVGYEIKLSNKNGAHCDICERLAGKYPLSFNWDGWHDGCTCYVTAIMKTEEEFFEWDDEKGNDTGSVNEVKDVPDNFKQWVLENRYLIEKYEDCGALPNFIKNNYDTVKNILICQIYQSIKSSIS